MEFALGGRRPKWDAHKQEIMRLYEDKETLAEVMQEMEEKHGFHASKRQYVQRLTEWRVKKYALQSRESSIEGEGVSRHSGIDTRDEDDREAAVQDNPVATAIRRPDLDLPPQAADDFSHVEEAVDFLLDDEADGLPHLRASNQRRISSALAGGMKRPKDADSMYPCPFRQRSPAKYNARDFPRCLLSSARLVEIRIHVRREHDPQPCPRCERYFSDEALYDHLRHGVPCPSSEGRGKTIRQRNNDVQDFWQPLTSSNTSFHGWDGLWKLLFPQDEAVPPPTLVPHVESHEVDIPTLASKLTAKMNQHSPAQISEDEVKGILSEEFRAISRRHLALQRSKFDPSPAAQRRRLQ